MNSSAKFFFHLQESSRQITSLCPILGKQYAKLRNGTCPWHLQHPIGKSLPISFVGTYPFITYNPIGGRDLKVIAALAKKFRFLPNLVPMASFDGMGHHVNNKYLINLNFLIQILNRLRTNIQN